MINNQLEEYDYRFRNPNTIQLYDNKRFAAEISFQIKGNELWITNLFRTEFATAHGRPGRHYGTEIFAILLMHLFKNGESFDYILGRLAYHDAENGYWTGSIPYYARFVQYVPEVLGYNLKFYLFEDKDAMQAKKAVELPDYHDRETFRNFVEVFRQKHIHQCKDAYFCYVVERNC